MKSSFCIDLQRFMLIPTKFPLIPSSYYGFLFCNNYAKYKEKAGYLKVGQGSLCPVLQQPKYVSPWRTWHGGHRPTWRMHPFR